MGNALRLGQGREGRHREALHLVGVEDAVAARHEPPPLVARLAFAGSGRRIALAAVAVEDLPEDDKRRLLAFAHLGALGLPLLIGAPNAGTETGSLRLGPKGNRIDAAIRLATLHVHRSHGRAAVRVPWHLEALGARLDGRGDLGSNAGVNVLAVALVGHVLQPFPWMRSSARRCFPGPRERWAGGGNRLRGDPAAGSAATEAGRKPVGGREGQRPRPPA